MNASNLNDKFARIGARLKVTDFAARRRRSVANGLVTLDVQADRDGEYFDVSRAPTGDAEVEVLDVRPLDRHLLLLVREGDDKHKFLCGHDERHWFVAAIPEKAAVGTVQQAKEALKPAPVKLAQSQSGLKAKARNRRKNAAYVRQGEWFFIPAVGLKVDPKLVICDEPITRGNGSKPHLAEFCVRSGGEAVYVCQRHPNGVTERQYRQIVSRNRSATSWGWRMLRRNPDVYVRGRIRHADHKTVVLHEWHRVLMNTESESKAMRNVAFLD